MAAPRSDTSSVEVSPHSSTEMSPNGRTDVLSPVTPTRRNKRKMTEPRKRADAVVAKRLCHSRDDVRHEEGPCARLVPPGTRSDGEDQSPGRSSGDDEMEQKTPHQDYGSLYRRPYIGLTLPSVHLATSPHLLNTARSTTDHPSSTPTTNVTNPNLLNVPLTVINTPDLSPGAEDEGDDEATNRRNRKNYKNMTRERRVEANARERSRVHTISAAFESLRRAVPSYSYNQKLSKLAILRIACSYILALAKLADLDYTHDQSDISFTECVDMCTATIQTEGKARRRH